MQFWQLITVNETILVTVFDLMFFAKGGGLDEGAQLWQKNKFTIYTLVRIFSKGLLLAGRGSGLVRWQARMENWAW